MLEMCDFLAGKAIHIGSIDSKHNIKIGRYQIVGGYFIVSVGKLVVDSHQFIKSQVSPDLIRPKDFDSVLLIQNLTSYSTLNKFDDAIYDGYTVGKIEDIGGLGCTLFSTRLHLNAVNGRTVPSNHRALYL